MTERVRETDGEVVEAVQAMYGAYGNRAAFDAHLHPEVTIWESDQPGEPIGLPELDALRDNRSAASTGPLPVLSVHGVLVDRWGTDAAVARYLLRAETPDGTMAFRVSDVFTGGPGGWRIVHHHAEQLDRPADGHRGELGAGPTAVEG